jgi:hypothetical protein
MIWFQRFLFLVCILIVTACSTTRLDPVRIYPKQTFEGTISAGAPFLLFTQNDHTEMLMLDQTGSSIYKTIHNYLIKQPPHLDSMSDSGDARSAHIVFSGQIISTYFWREKPENYIRIFRIKKLSPVTPDYLAWRAKQ